MIIFNVVKEKHGWAIRMGECMMTPFWSRDQAIQEANCLADAIRRHGVGAEVVVEQLGPSDRLAEHTSSGSSRADGCHTGT
jgi:hypothetical protein